MTGFSFDSLTRGYALCQAGMSAHVTPDDFALFGAPGSVTWRGTVFASNVSTDWLADKTQYRLKVDENAVRPYSYLGTFTVFFFPCVDQSWHVFAK